MSNRSKPVRAFRTNALAMLGISAALIAASAGLVHANESETQAAPASASTPSGGDFAQQFAQVSQPSLRRAPAAGAVDITKIDIPVELPPEPEPEPATSTRSLGTGVASYYGHRFHGRLTANGERFDMNAMTAAHKTLPFGTRVRVTNPRNGKSVVVRINDRGPFIRGRTIDLSRSAAQRVGIIQRGHGRVQLDIIS